jgi:hypothetical protein
MAFSTLNDRITDSVTATDAMMLGSAPAMAMGNLYMATSQALAGAALNATQAQQANNQIAQAVTAINVDLLYSMAPKRKS